MLVRVFLSISQYSLQEYTQALALVKGINAQDIFADRAYETDAIVEQATKQEMEVVIPGKKNRKQKRQYER